MKYIIMCGGTYREWDKPRQLTEINGEPVVARTIRLLREAGVEDISISSTFEEFEQFGVPVLKHDNHYQASVGYSELTGYWCDGFYPMDEPVCYVFGDVVFSPEAIKTIAEYETDDIMFFGSKRPFSAVYPKEHEEPFAFKVVNTDHFHEAIEKHKRLTEAGTHWRKPIAWELWFIIQGQDPAEDLKNLKNNSYVGINDYTCDVDWRDDPERIEEAMEAWYG